MGGCNHRGYVCACVCVANPRLWRSVNECDLERSGCVGGQRIDRQKAYWLADHDAGKIRRRKKISCCSRLEPTDGPRDQKRVARVKIGEKKKGERPWAGGLTGSEDETISKWVGLARPSRDGSEPPQTPQSRLPKHLTHQQASIARSVCHVNSRPQEHRRETRDDQKKENPSRLRVPSGLD